MASLNNTDSNQTTVSPRRWADSLKPLKLRTSGTCSSYYKKDQNLADFDTWTHTYNRMQTYLYSTLYSLFLVRLLPFVSLSLSIRRFAQLAHFPASETLDPTFHASSASLSLRFFLSFPLETFQIGGHRG